MTILDKPSLFKTPENKGFLDSLADRIIEYKKNHRIFLEYPIVYIHYWPVESPSSDPNRPLFEIYIGESNDIVERTREHYNNGKKTTEWSYSLVHSKATPELLVIGHEHFNKSLTLDIENRLIQYALAMHSVKTVHNRKGNPQRFYYPVNEFEDLFDEVWDKLRRHNRKLFLSKAEIQDSAIFKASPFHKLTDQQFEAQNAIVDKVTDALANGKTGQLIFVEGEAGTGKTVLTNSTFYKLLDNEQKPKCHLLVNHEEQVRVYQDIALKLRVNNYETLVSRPTSFINNQSPDNPIDVAFVDEAHLLWTQGKQSYRGKNQLDDIMARSRVTVIMFDEYQILTTEEYWEPEQIEEKRQLSKSQGNYLQLTNQLRMHTGQDIIDWIDAITKDFVIKPLSTNTKNYDLQIMDSPFTLFEAIKEKASEKESRLSRLIASYDWDYSSDKVPEDGSKYWGVKILDSDSNKVFFKPWNRELFSSLAREEKKKIRQLAWAEQPQTINEIGSTYTIQGFDLVYSGVIIGPSVKYRNNRIIFDPKESCNDKAIRNRTLSDGKKRRFEEYLLSHELRILLTRGVKGMYIYACDDALRQALKESLSQ